MDTPATQTSPIAEAPVARVPFLQTQVGKIALPIVALVLLIAALVLWLRFAPVMKRDSSLVVAAGVSRTAPLYSITAATTTQLRITAEGSERLVLGMVSQGGNGTIYSLLESDDSTGSDLFRVSADGTVSRLTSTGTTKTFLALDPSGRFLAFESSPVMAMGQQADPSTIEILELDVETGETRRIANGFHPRYLANGALVAGTINGISVFARNGESSGVVILDPVVYTLYDTSADGAKVAALNRVTGKIDLFSSVSGGSLSFDSSIDTVEGQTITNLTFLDAGPASVASTPTPTGTRITTTVYGSSASAVTVTAAPGVTAQRIFYVTR